MYYTVFYLLWEVDNEMIPKMTVAFTWKLSSKILISFYDKPQPLTDPRGGFSVSAGIWILLQIPARRDFLQTVHFIHSSLWPALLTASPPSSLPLPQFLVNSASDFLFCFLSLVSFLSFFFSSPPTKTHTLSLSLSLSIAISSFPVEINYWVGYELAFKGAVLHTCHSDRYIYLDKHTHIWYHLTGSR